MTYLVDSDWLIDLLGGRSRATQLLEELTPLGLAVSIISYGELFEGAMGAPDSDARLARMRATVAPMTLMPLTDPLMEVFARLRAELRRTGRMIPDMDLLIAATAQSHDLILITRNVRHFGRIPGLRLFQSDNGQR